MQRTVKEFLWGYQDPVLSSLKNYLPQLVSNDQVSVFASAVIFFIDLHCFYPFIPGQ